MDRVDELVVDYKATRFFKTTIDSLPNWFPTQRHMAYVYIFFLNNRSFMSLGTQILVVLRE